MSGILLRKMSTQKGYCHKSSDKIFCGKTKDKNEICKKYEGNDAKEGEMICGDAIYETKDVDEDQTETTYRDEKKSNVVKWGWADTVSLIAAILAIISFIVWFARLEKDNQKFVAGFLILCCILYSIC